jgi:hypothetical protein
MWLSAQFQTLWTGCVMRIEGRLNMNNDVQKMEIADVFHNSFRDYIEHFGKQPRHHYKVANAIIRCRTEQMGGHIYRCESCSHEQTLYNSCRNRHCPKCQAAAREQWVKKRIDELLPVPYFHVVFTLPQQLNWYALRNKKVFYNLMFKSVSETLSDLGRDKRFFGGQMGAICVLHTWGQNLMDHPHIHCIVPAGAWCADKKQWKQGKKKILFPVAVMRRMYRGKMLAYFSEAVNDKTLCCIKMGNKPTVPVKELINQLYKRDWVVYVKKPFARPIAVIKYLGRYTHRVAISNNRIKGVNPQQVSFSYKDYAENNRNKIMRLTQLEFIRRFMLHILPDGFMRIRCYGFLSNRTKNDALPLIRKYIVVAGPVVCRTMEKTPDTKHMQMYCPKCKGTILTCIGIIEPYQRLSKMGIID